MTNDPEKERPVREDVPVNDFAPFVAPEHSLGIQVAIGGAVKEKLDGNAASALKSWGESFLHETVLEGRSIATFEQRGTLDPKVRPDDLVRALDRVVLRHASRGQRSSKFRKFIHEVPVGMSAVGLTKFAEGLAELTRQADRGTTLIVVDMTEACACFILAFLIAFLLSERE
jgi:hypothetical protein